VNYSILGVPLLPERCIFRIFHNVGARRCTSRDALDLIYGENYLLRSASTDSAVNCMNISGAEIAGAVWISFLDFSAIMDTSVHQQRGLRFDLCI
jgi:hypothetical protein